MRQLLFQAIITLLLTVDKFKGEDGTVRVFDFPTTNPGGYPYVVVGSESLESTVVDNARDSRRYNYTVQIVGEKFGEQGGLTQSDALEAMRNTEDVVLALFDGNYFLGRTDVVVRTMPTLSTYGYTDGGGRVVLTIHVSVDTTVNITTNN